MVNPRFALSLRRVTRAGALWASEEQLGALWASEGTKWKSGKVEGVKVAESRKELRSTRLAAVEVNLFDLFNHGLAVVA